MPVTSKQSFHTIEATVTSKGQVTLPSELRKRLGLRQGSRIRFSMPTSGEARIETVRYSIRDLWRMSDEMERSDDVMSFDQMNAAKVRRKSR